MQNSKIDTISLPWYIFGSPGGTLGAIATKMRDAALGQTCALHVQNFSQIRSVVSEEMHPEQKDRQANHAEDNNDTFIAYTGCFKKVAP